MIIYFANRNMKILGNASTSLPEGLRIKEDVKAEDIETGIATFECYLPFDDKTRLSLQNCTKAGNYILRSNEDENEFYTIIETEIDTKNREIYIYAESAGLDLLNEVVSEYSADHAYTIDHYIDKFSKDSGFKIGINEAEDKSLQLSFEGEETATSRIEKIAALFNAEISYSFKTNGLKVTDKIINIYEKRGKKTGVQLRINKELDKITTKTTVANVATAFLCEGGTPEGAESPITLKGYSYDDGDFYIEGKKLYSRKALEKWSRYLWAEEPNQLSGYEGHIVKTFSSNVLTQKELCDEAIAELKKVREVEANYEIEFNEKPENIKIGDTVYVVDDAGDLYLSTRILQLEESIANQTFKVTLGDFLLKDSGISARVEQLAAEFAKNTVSVKRATSIANDARKLATQAHAGAVDALNQSTTALAVAGNAENEVNKAYQAATDAEAKAVAAEEAVKKVEDDVASITATVENAQAAAEEAAAAAEIATKAATETAQMATEAKAEAEAASQNADEAKTAAEATAVKADEAKTSSDEAKELAVEASTIAQAAKLDAQKAEKDIEIWAENLETYKQTASAEYARKTDLTETEVALQSQITSNAYELEIAHKKVTKIDETTNNAAEKAELAQEIADLAQQQADKASEDAQIAQAAAEEAAASASLAQANADRAKATATSAQSKADRARINLEAAQNDLETVTSRADATQEEIAAAEEAVRVASIAYNTAAADANTAKATATEAQNVANAAKETADKAQATADKAAAAAETAQTNAEQANGNAEEALKKANAAKAVSEQAQTIANVAMANAENAQATANAAVANAETAQQTAEAAKTAVAQAEIDLSNAKQNLNDVLSRVDATEAEVEAAEEAVNIAQTNAQTAQANAEATQQAADEAKANAQAAQQAADEAREEAQAAQQAAAEAQAAVKSAWEYVLDLAVRVITTATDIQKNSSQIALTATKQEVKETLGGYYNKTETDAALTVKADEITSTVKSDFGTRLSTAETQITQLAENIKMLVRNGDKQAQMIFDEETATWSFNTGAIDESISNQAKAIGKNATAIDDVANKVNSFEEHISITTYEDEPCIILYEKDSDKKQIITNTRRIYIQTINGEEKILSQETLEGLTTNSVQIGGFAWKKQGTNRIGLVWEGVVE